MTAQVHDYPPPPFIAGLPFIGQGLKMRGDIWDFFTQLYLNHGEIVRVTLLGRQVVIMGGLAVNQWFIKNQDYFVNYDVYATQADAWHAPYFIIASDGDDHRLLRRTVRRAQSVSALTERLPEVIEQAQGKIQTWQVGEVFPIWKMWQSLVTNQLGLVAVNRDVSEYFDDLQRFFTWTTHIDIGQTLPRWFVHLPRFKNTIHRLETFAKMMIEDHQQRRSAGDHGEYPRSIVDDLLDARDENPDAWPDSVLVASTIGPLIAGMDTVASTMSFVLYIILKHPAIYEQIQAEVDAAFADGTPLTEKKLAEMAVLNATVHETLRLYPVGGATPRMTRESFVYNGFRVEKGTRVYIANSVPHFLEELYPDPLSFNPNRPMKPPAPLAFTPFSLGSHTCLGAGFARLQILLNIALVFRHVHLSLEPSDYTLKPQASPIPNTGYQLKAKITEKRAF